MKVHGHLLSLKTRKFFPEAYDILITTLSANLLPFSSTCDVQHPISRLPLSGWELSVRFLRLPKLRACTLAAFETRIIAKKRLATPRRKIRNSGQRPQAVLTPRLFPSQVLPAWKHRDLISRRPPPRNSLCVSVANLRSSRSSSIAPNVVLPSFSDLAAEKRFTILLFIA